MAFRERVTLCKHRYCGGSVALLVSRHNLLMYIYSQVIIFT